MRKILSRIDKLEKTNKSKLIEIESKLQREALREEYFHFLNQIMKEHFPTHVWTRLSSKEKERIYFTPFNMKESNLLGEVLRLVADVIGKEIFRRRKLARGKIKNN